MVLFAPGLAKANVGIGKPNTAGSTALVIWNSDGGWDAEIASTGSDSLINLLTSAGAFTAGAGFNFTVTTLQVAPGYNGAASWATAASAIQAAITGGTVQPLVNASGNPTYCIIFDMRFLQTNNPPTAHPGQIGGDTITSGDIALYQAYLAAGGSLFIMGDNYWGGAENGFITREENMYQMINAVAATGIGPNSDNILSPGNAVDPANAVAGAPYSLDTNYNNVTALSMTGDFVGPIDNSAGGLGTGKPWVVMTSDNNPHDVLVAAWSGAAGDLAGAYVKGSMMYWGDSNILQAWAAGGGGTPTQFMENAVAWLFNGNCCTPPSTPACPSGTDVQVSGGNPNLVSCFASSLNGWTGNSSVWDGTKSVEASGGSMKDAIASTVWSAASLFTSPTFAAGTLTPYEGICFEMQNATGTTLTFELHGAGTAWPNQISSPTSFTVPSDGAWHNICLSFAADYTSATNIQIYVTSTGFMGNIWVDSVKLQSGCSPNPMVADPSCCGVVDTPTFTRTATNTYTPTFTSTPTNTYTKTFTATFTNTATKTYTSTFTNTPTNTYTATITDSPTPSNTYTDTPTLMNTATKTNTPTPTVTNTVTDTPTPSNTFTNTYTSTPTFTYTDTFVNSPTFTNTFTNTYTPSPTPTYTDTFTDTPTFTYTNTFMNSPTFTNTFTSTLTDTQTNTYTPTPTDTNTPTQTFTSTFTNTPVAINTSTFTNTPTSTNTFTPTSTPTSLVSIAKVVSENQVNAGDVLTYSIGVTIGGLSVNSAVVTDTLPADMTFVSFGSSPSGTTSSFNTSTDQLTWTLPSPLAPGVYTFTYQTKVNTFAPANVPLRNGVAITYPGLPTPITTSVPVTVVGNFTVKINIYNSAGEIVKSIPIEKFSSAINSITLSKTNTITTLSGDGSFIDILFNGYIIGVWDGTTNSGSPVANGAYTIQIDNVDNSGVVTSVSQKAIVNRSLSNVEVDIFNEAGEVVRKLYNVLSNATNSTMTNVKLSTNVLRPSLSAPVSAYSSTASYLSIVAEDSSSPVTLIWDGTSDGGSLVSPGEYEVQVHWTDGNGTTTDITRTVLVLPVSSISGIAMAEPNVLTSATTMTTTFDATRVLNATAMKIKIFTVAGELVQSFSVGSNTAPWNASGLASGIYIANVEIDNASGGVINTQRLKILVLH